MFLADTAVWKCVCVTNTINLQPWRCKNVPFIPSKILAATRSMHLILSSSDMASPAGQRAQSQIKKSNTHLMLIIPNVVIPEHAQGRRHRRELEGGESQPFTRSVQTDRGSTSAALFSRQTGATTGICRMKRRFLSNKFLIRRRRFRSPPAPIYSDRKWKLQDPSTSPASWRQARSGRSLVHAGSSHWLFKKEIFKIIIIIIIVIIYGGTNCARCLCCIHMESGGR